MKKSFKLLCSKKLFFIFLLASIYPAFSQAEETGSGDWSFKAKVVEINAGYKNGMVLFKTDKPHYASTGNCTNTLYGVVPELANVDQILSILLAAQRSQSEISVGIDPSKCAHSYIAVTRVRAW